MENTALAADPFESAMSNLRAAGIDFEEVDPDPPDKTGPPPGEEGGPDESDSDGASPETVAEASDTSRRVAVGEWRRALLTADELNATERHVGLTLAEYMDRDGGGAFPTQETLAAACRRTEKTIRRALHAIEQAGYLRVRRTGRASRYMAVVPQGGDVIDFPRTGPDVRSEPVQMSGQNGHQNPPTQPTTQPTTQKSAPTSLTDDQELFQAMLVLAEVSGARSPKAWVAKVYAEDIAPIIEEQGRDAALVEIQRRTVEAQPRHRRRTHHRPPDDDHGSEVVAVENW
jgi:hypothetical protein